MVKDAKRAPQRQLRAVLEGLPGRFMLKWGVGEGEAHTWKLADRRWKRTMSTGLTLGAITVSRLHVIQ